MKTKYIIRTGEGSLIAGFNAEHQCVQIAGAPSSAKQFATQKTAQKFIDRYSNAGYGLMHDNVTIESITVQ